MKWLEMLEMAKNNPRKLYEYAKNCQSSFSTGFKIGVMHGQCNGTNKLPKSLNLGYLSAQESMAWNALDKTPNAWKTIQAA